MPPSSTTQRLLRELKEYTNNPNEALLHLGPIDEDDLYTWEAVLKGVKGTPYEGKAPFKIPLKTLQPPSTRNTTRQKKWCTNPDQKPTTDGLWSLSIQIPTNYPLSPPTIRFTTRISHPNISFTTGEICLTLLTTEHWSPVYTLSSTLTAVHQLLTDPRPDSPLNVDVAALLRDGDIPAWESVVRYYTKEERWRGRV
jgi:peroxin-4